MQHRCYLSLRHLCRHQRMCYSHREEVAEAAVTSNDFTKNLYGDNQTTALQLQVRNLSGMLLRSSQFRSLLQMKDL